MENSALSQKTVIIATVCNDGKADVFFVHSLSDTIKLGIQSGINIVPIFVSQNTSEAMLKNELLDIAYSQNADSIIFTNNDIAWDAGCMIQMILSDLPVTVLPTVIKKPNGLIYDIDFNKDNLEYNDQGYLKVNYASAACMKFNKNVIQALYDSNISVISDNGNEVKNVFETQTQYGRYFDESVVICNKLKDLDISIWALPTTTCAQNTNNLFTADFPSWLNGMAQALQTPEDIKSLYE